MSTVTEIREAIGRLPPKEAWQLAAELREHLDALWDKQFEEDVKAGRLDDLIATATAFTAESIAHAYREFIGRHVDEMIVAGGGAKNPALLQMLRDRLPDTEIKVYEFLQEKEAMAMALIASDSISGLDTNVASVTGGHATILGKICL